MDNKKFTMLCVAFGVLAAILWVATPGLVALIFTMAGGGLIALAAISMSDDDKSDNNDPADRH